MKLIYIAFFCVTVSFAQSPFHISGTLISEENLPLESATVYLENPSDNSLATYTVSDRDGGFVLKGKSSYQSLNLYISYVGYTTYEQSILLDRRIIELDTIQLSVNANALQAVLVSRAPIIVKKDTLEFNVKSFKTKKDANIEDLLKKLPFVEVREDGSIKVNGKQVNQILVNGKPFFGNNITAATRNLTKDIIEKVQIVNTKTTSEAFRGEEGEKKEKTINLTIKKENNKGIFGRLSAGGGTEGRYDLSGILNWFSGNRSVNVVAGKNNIILDIPKIHRGDGATVSGAMLSTHLPEQGLSTLSNLGVNYVDKYVNKADFSTSFLQKGIENETESKTEQENILANSRYFSSSNSKTFTSNRFNQINMNFEVKVNPTLLITVSPTYNSSNNYSSSFNDESSFNNSKLLTNQSTASLFSKSGSTSFETGVEINKLLGNGGFLSFLINNEIKARELNRTIDSKVQFFDYDDTISEAVIRESIDRKQIVGGKEKANTLITNVIYRIPLFDKKLFLDLRYRYSRTQEASNNSTFDYNPIENGYTDFNLDLSTNYESITSESKPSVSLHYKNKKVISDLKFQSIITTLENKDELRPELTNKRTYETFMFNYIFSYSFSKKTSVQMGYNFYNKPPQLSQLLPFENITNPLNIIVGNPLLKPANNHNYMSYFRNYNFNSGLGFFITGEVNVLENQIVTKTVVDPQTLKRRTSYDNVNGSYNYNVSLGLMKKIKLDSISTLNVNLKLSNTATKQIHFINETKYASKNKSFEPIIQLVYNWKNIVEIKPSYNLSYTKTTFDIDAFKTTEFLTHKLRLFTYTFLTKKLEWSNGFNYNYNKDVAPGFQKSAWLWNSSFTYSTWKDKGFLSLKIFDLLNQNTNARRVANGNFIQDVQSTVLKQYFMLSFSMKI